MVSHLSQEFIQQQKKRLEEDRSKVLHEIADLKSADPFRDSEYTNDNAAIDTDVREQGSHQIIEAQVNELERRQVDIDLALQKIEKGTYGVCEKTNQPIPQTRLEIVPEARFIVAE